jgi:polysaccharide export outer membrane protein
VTLLVFCLAQVGCTSNSTLDTSVETASAPGTAKELSSGDGDLKVVSDLPAPTAVRSGVAQPIAVADVIEVSVFQVPDLSRTVQVDDRGYMSLPLVGQIPAAGMSVQSLQQHIERAYGASYLQSPSVSVFVKESASRRVTVDGEVRRSGVHPLPPTASLLDVIALAGGLTEVADPSKVYVFRKVDNTNYVANYSIAKIRQGGRKNPSVHGGDVVVVFPSQGRVALKNLK